MPSYPGPGKARFINSNQQMLFWQNELVKAGTASVAFLLERQKSAAYPFGAAIEVSFASDPGFFEIDVQGAETDQDANYCQLGSGMTVANASFVCRFDLTPSLYYPRFVRLFLKSLTNLPVVTAVLTR